MSLPDTPDNFDQSSIQGYLQRVYDDDNERFGRDNLILIFEIEKLRRLELEKPFNKTAYDDCCENVYELLQKNFKKVMNESRIYSPEDAHFTAVKPALDELYEKLNKEIDLLKKRDPSLQNDKDVKLDESIKNYYINKHESEKLLKKEEQKIPEQQVNLQAYHALLMDKNIKKQLNEEEKAYALFQLKHTAIFSHVPTIRNLANSLAEDFLTKADKKSDYQAVVKIAQDKYPLNMDKSSTKPPSDFNSKFITVKQSLNAPQKTQEKKVSAKNKAKEQSKFTKKRKKFFSSHKGKLIGGIVLAVGLGVLAISITVATMGLAAPVMAAAVGVGFVAMGAGAVAAGKRFDDRNSDGSFDKQLKKDNQQSSHDNESKVVHKPTESQTVNTVYEASVQSQPKISNEGYTLSTNQDNLASQEPLSNAKGFDASLLLDPSLLDDTYSDTLDISEQVETSSTPSVESAQTESPSARPPQKSLPDVPTAPTKISAPSNLDEIVKPKAASEPIDQQAKQSKERPRESSAKEPEVRQFKASKVKDKIAFFEEKSKEAQRANDSSAFKAKGPK